MSIIFKDEDKKTYLECEYKRLSRNYLKNKYDSLKFYWAKMYPKYDVYLVLYYYNNIKCINSLICEKMMNFIDKNSFIEEGMRIKEGMKKMILIKKLKGEL